MLPFQGLLIQDFTPFSHKKALLKQKALAVDPDQSTCNHSLSPPGGSKCKLHGRADRRKDFASEIPSHTSKPILGSPKHPKSFIYIGRIYLC